MNGKERQPLTKLDISGHDAKDKMEGEHAVYEDYDRRKEGDSSRREIVQLDEDPVQKRNHRPREAEVENDLKQPQDAHDNAVVEFGDVSL